MGEIITVRVSGFETSGKMILQYTEQPLNIISQSHPPQSFTDSSPFLLEKPMMDEASSSTMEKDTDQELSQADGLPFNNLFLSKGPGGDANVQMHTPLISAFQYQPQNSSYLFNNNFYQNYVSDCPKVIAIKFHNNGNFSTATITPTPEMIGMP